VAILRRAASALARSANDPTSTIQTRRSGELTASTLGVGSPAALAILAMFMARVRAAVSVPNTPAETVHGASWSGAGRASAGGSSGPVSAASGGIDAGAGGSGAGAGVAGRTGCAAATARSAASFACSRASSASRPRRRSAAAEYSRSASFQRCSETACAACITMARPETIGSALRAATAKASRASSRRPSSCAAQPST
jgi:hypothetical protein